MGVFEWSNTLVLPPPPFSPFLLYFLLVAGADRSSSSVCGCCIPTTPTEPARRRRSPMRRELRLLNSSLLLRRWKSSQREFVLGRGARGAGGSLAHTTKCVLCCAILCCIWATVIRGCRCDRRSRGQLVLSVRNIIVVEARVLGKIPSILPLP